MNSLYLYGYPVDPRVQVDILSGLATLSMVALSEGSSHFPVLKGSDSVRVSSDRNMKAML